MTISQEYHGISPDAMHTSDMNPDNIKGNIMASAPVKSTRIRYVVVRTTVKRLHALKLGLEEAFLDLA